MRGQVRPGRRQAAGDRGARSVWRGGLGCRYGAGHGEERTANMEFMLVTLEVSKLSGWLNAEANCRESKGRHNVRGEVRAEAGGGGGRSRCTQRAGEGSTLQIGSRAGGGAHREHSFHVCDAGGVEAQQLVERRRILPRVERRANGAGRRAGWKVGGGGRPRRKQRAQVACRLGLDCRYGAGHGEERTANMTLMSVTPDVSKSRGWLNAVAPLNMSAMSLTLAVARLGCSSSAGAPAESSRRERTADKRALRRPVATTSTPKLSGELNTTAPRNMPLMSVTLEVSKHSGWLNADAL